MNEFFNWGGTFILFQHNWLWFILALLIGAWVGWTTCGTSRSAKN